MTILGDDDFGSKAEVCNLSLSAFRERQSEETG